MTDEDDIPESRSALAAFIDRFPPYVMLTMAVTGTIVSAAGAYFALGSSIREFDAWRVQHLEHHRERAAETAAQFASVNQQLAGVVEDRRRIDELSFRIGAAEENARRTAEAIAELQASVNDQASDIRVMREILERLDQRRAALKPRRSSADDEPG